MKNFKEIAVGVIALVVIIIWGSIYSDVFSGLWVKLINAVSGMF